jgi:hypothetical protein
MWLQHAGESRHVKLVKATRKVDLCSFDSDDVYSREYSCSTFASEAFTSEAFTSEAFTSGLSIHFLSLFQLLIRGPVKNEEALTLYSRA